jgi:succinate-semialdehyde dehydrogenase/glutarate-semialdehyde dehydrogenase
MSAASFPVIDPATEETLDHVQDFSPDGATSAVDRAEAAQHSWRSVPPREKAELLRAVFEAMTAQRDPLAELIVAENGKSLADARSEVTYAAEFFRWFSEEAVRIEGSLVTAPSGDKRIIVIHQPAGVAALVTPWNFPTAMAARKIAPALAAGCGVVLKPAEETPLSALALGRICTEVGIPSGLVEVTPTTDAAGLVARLLDDDRIKVLSFTGSTEVGRQLLRAASVRIVNTSMELGGNAPVIVCADASVEEAVAGAMAAKMRNGGAACTAANRFYVHESVAGDFTDALAERMSSLRVGPGSDPTNDVGPLVSAKERDKVDELVTAAVADGARVVAARDERPDRGYFVQPTVLADVRPDAAILRREIFGPVAPIVTYNDDREAVALANEAPHGLVAYVFTRDLARGLNLAEQLEVGMVGLNRGTVSDPAAPFGGWKQSGIGREGGHIGIHEFLETKYIAANW